ncbi:DNA N-6-adenine-methyltransferase [Microbacterium sp. PA5]|uniref:DNA N-6-adenine-methyltransferase n=1 Tax=Microbacterium sp. PA5 TaxID=3416654 RepID=UPI003CF5CCDF
MTGSTNALRRRAANHIMQRQLTPAYVLEPVRAALGGTITLDPCTEPDNPTGATRFYTAEDDGLAQPWGWADSIYVNPPYGEARDAWVKYAASLGASGTRVIVLMPAHTDTRVFQEALSAATSMVLIKGRVKFGVLRENRRQEAASHPSALIGWNVDLAECEHLGHRFTLTNGSAVQEESNG